MCLGVHCRSGLVPIAATMSLVMSVFGCGIIAGDVTGKQLAPHGYVAMRSLHLLLSSLFPLSTASANSKHLCLTLHHLSFFGVFSYFQKDCKVPVMPGPNRLSFSSPRAHTPDAAITPYRAGAAQTHTVSKRKEEE